MVKSIGSILLFLQASDQIMFELFNLGEVSNIDSHHIYDCLIFLLVMWQGLLPVDVASQHRMTIMWLLIAITAWKLRPFHTSSQVILYLTMYDITLLTYSRFYSDAWENAITFLETAILRPVCILCSYSHYHSFLGLLVYLDCEKMIRWQGHYYRASTHHLEGLLHISSIYKGLLFQSIYWLWDLDIAPTVWYLLDHSFPITTIIVCWPIPSMGIRKINIDGYVKNKFANNGGIICDQDGWCIWTFLVSYGDSLILKVEL